MTNNKKIEDNKQKEVVGEQKNFNSSTNINNEIIDNKKNNLSNIKKDDNKQENKAINSSIIAGLKTTMTNKVVQNNSKDLNIMSSLNKNQIINNSIKTEPTVENKQNIKDIQNNFISVQ